MNDLRTIKSNLICFVILGVFLLPISMHGEGHSRLLSNEDLFLEYKDRELGPELSSGISDPNPWESYNQWMCFNASQVHLTQVKVKYEGKDKTMPQLEVSLLGHSFEISLSADTEYDNDLIFEMWQNLLKESKEVCAYAAYLTHLNLEGELPTSLWIISRLKSESGLWIEQERL
jgi:hypothetical protein